MIVVTEYSRSAVADAVAVHQGWSGVKAKIARLATDDYLDRQRFYGRVLSSEELRRHHIDCVTQVVLQSIPKGRACGFIPIPAFIWASIVSGIVSATIRLITEWLVCMEETGENVFVLFVSGESADHRVYAASVSHT